MSDNKRIAILPPAYPNMPRSADLARLAAAGERPRKDYVELARVLDADVDMMDRGRAKLRERVAVEHSLAHIGRW